MNKNFDTSFQRNYRPRILKVRGKKLSFEVLFLPFSEIVLHWLQNFQSLKKTILDRQKLLPINKLRNVTFKCKKQAGIVITSP